MLSLEPEIRELHRSGRLDAAAMMAAVARETGRPFSVHRELLLALYGSVAAVIAGVGLLVRSNLDRIGPVTLIAALLACAAICYAGAIRTAVRGKARSIAGDYVLLLGALLLSATLGYAELQFHWLGTDWSRHLLLLAAVHGITAYLLESRLLLSVALTAFAGWMGIETRFSELLDGRAAWRAAGFRSLACAAIVLAAREAHRRLGSARDFAAVFEHFAANLAFWGALVLSFDSETRLVGVPVLAVVTVIVAVIGLQRPRESYVLYAIGYATLGACTLEAQLLHDALLAAITGLATILLASWLLWRTRARLKAAPL